MNNKRSFKKMPALISFIIILLTAVSLVACQANTFIPGASFGYFVTEDGEGNIDIEWSIDRRDSDFSGWIATDGTIVDYGTISFEEEDNLKLGEDGRLVFDSTLSAEDYSDGITLDLDGYSYIEMELKINDGYDLERVHLGRFLNNPKNGIFRVEKGDMLDAGDIPLYERPPIRGFLYKLKTDMVFTLVYIFVIGVIVLEIIRITALSKRKRRLWILIPLYGLLAAIIITVYFVLKNLKF